jgi:hypothetical protein
MKDIIRMNQLAGIITENQAQKMMEVLDENKPLNEEKLKIKSSSSGLKEKPGYVDTILIDKLLKQIGPHIGYANWKELIKNPDYKGIIKKIAKYISNTGTLQNDRIDFI